MNYPSEIQELLQKCDRQLEKERWNDNDGNPETNSALVIRQLEKLMETEYQGY